MIEQLPIDRTVFDWIVGIFDYSVERWVVMRSVGMNDRRIVEISNKIDRIDELLTELFKGGDECQPMQRN